MNPWYRGFKGEIRKTGENKYDVFGCVRKINDTTVEITELPIHKWTQTYKGELEAMIGEKGDGVIKVRLPLLPSHRLKATLTSGATLWYCRTTRSTTTTRTSTSSSTWPRRISRRQRRRV